MIIALSFAFLAAAAQADQPVVQMTGPNGTTSTMPLELPQSDARLSQAKDLIAKGQPAAALPLADQVIADYEAKYRSNGQIIYYSARSLEEGFVYSTLAGMAGRNGVVLNGDWTQAYFLKGFALVELNRSDEAIRWFDKAAALAPMNAQVLAERAEWYKARRDWKKAYREFESARSAAGFAADDAKAREEGRAIRGMAFVRIEQGRLDEAERLLGEALKLDPADQRARDELATIAAMRRR
ncbi:MAG TPA: tetratricopeptide repeat protein [Sphingomicrobium sp.]|nr:tetratricopeptide repeat protein [Sphingomicrobium sp.]